MGFKPTASKLETKGSNFEELHFHAADRCKAYALVNKLQNTKRCDIHLTAEAPIHISLSILKHIGCALGAIFVQLRRGRLTQTNENRIPTPGAGASQPRDLKFSSM